MKKLFLLIGLAAVVTAGCASNSGTQATPQATSEQTTTVQKVENWVTDTAEPDVCAAARYYTTYFAGVATLVGAGCGVEPFVLMGNSVAGELNTMCSQGASAADASAAIAKADAVAGKINAANTPKTTAKQSSVPATTTTAPVTATTTTTAPATGK
jgi:hypothetical protein